MGIKVDSIVQLLVKMPQKSEFIYFFGMLISFLLIYIQEEG
jgi:hypothetical protein